MSDFASSETLRISARLYFCLSTYFSYEQRLIKQGELMNGKAILDSGNAVATPKSDTDVQIYLFYSFFSTTTIAILAPIRAQNALVD